jgi:hypothetical protein
MQIAKAISKYGNEAVLRYCDVAGIPEDSQLPEIFLGGTIACGIYDESKLCAHAHVERLYTKILEELGKERDSRLINLFGGQRADVAVYRAGRPIAIIELKKFDDWKSPAGIVSDRDKVRILAQECGISSYIGVLITDVEKPMVRTCADRRSLLEQNLQQKFDVPGETTWSRNGKWQWCFASLRVQ